MYIYIFEDVYTSIGIVYRLFVFYWAIIFQKSFLNRVFSHVCNRIKSWSIFENFSIQQPNNFRSTSVNKPGRFSETVLRKYRSNLKRKYPLTANAGLGQLQTTPNRTTWNKNKTRNCIYSKEIVHHYSTKRKIINYP